MDGSKSPQDDLRELKPAKMAKETQGKRGLSEGTSRSRGGGENHPSRGAS